MHTSYIKLRHCSSAAALLVTLFSFSCDPGGSALLSDSGSVTTVHWDTTFTVAGLSFPDSSTSANSVIATGGEKRFGALYRKLLDYDTVRIGAIGGSITQAEGYHSYGQRLCEFLDNNFPDNRFELINAGIGATNSRFACSRVRDDLFNHSPDLIIIEFAVNDVPADSAPFEGLIRLCLKNTAGPVILLFTMNNTLNDSVETMQTRIGACYDLPMISYRNALSGPLASGDLPWNAIATDMVHPNNSGHLLMGYLLYTFISSFLDTTPVPDADTAGLPPFLISDFYESAGMYDTACGLIAVTGIEWWNLRIGACGRIGFTASESNATITLHSTARELVIGYRYSGAHDAILDVTVDSVPVIAIGNFFPDDPGDGFMALYTIYTDSIATGHDIGFIKSAGNIFTIEALLLVE
ncbi:MAG: SGNH/GDSL hydrolase family protein [Chitinispirillaceae bacterium]|nr:SGNH/GDSL hydrolase family protein [Chitinispirillaceae bacterium]